MGRRASNLLQLLHQVGGVGHYFIVRVMKTSLDDLIHDMVITWRIGDLVSSVFIAGEMQYSHQ